MYEQADKSFCPSAAIETEDSCLIIAVFDYYGGRGELKKLSKDGVLLKRLPIGNDDVFSGVEGLYRDPWHTRGRVAKRMSSIHYAEILVHK